MLRERRPRAVVSTFPLYPHFLGELGRRVGWSGKVWTVVTDSITIHPVWVGGDVDGWFVTDEFTAEVMCGAGVDGRLVWVSGFPVPMVFGEADRCGEREGGAMRVLYLATTGRRHAEETLRSLLGGLPDGTELSVVMGRSEARLRAVLSPVVAAAGGRLKVELAGWCGDIPARMGRADVVVTKAGGATVHECLAAGVPAVVNYVIPGQEEGNIALLERLGAGCRAPREAADCGAFVRSLAESGKLLQMRDSARRQGRSDGAMVVARRISSELS
jgi:processive 1,2-diacylglycerol beta-glucosyltransferase